jgi:hypothetical protein
MKDERSFSQIEKLALPCIVDPRGNLTFLQYPEQVPFVVKRVFWIHGVPAGESRGGHAYKTQHELIVSVSGSFDVVVSHPNEDAISVQMNRPFRGIHIPPNSWRHLENFSSNSVSLHLSSGEFDEGEYIRDWALYIEKYTRL